MPWTEPGRWASGFLWLTTVAVGAMALLVSSCSSSRSDHPAAPQVTLTDVTRFYIEPLYGELGDA